MVAERANREQRAIETRRKIFAAAAELFGRRGYHETTVAEIAERAGVAKGTFFVHFATKDAVVTELVRIQTRAARRARAAIVEAGGSPLDCLRATVLTLGEQAAASKPLSRAVLAAGLESPKVGGESAAFFNEVYALMIDDAKAAVAAGQLAERDPELIARSLMASYLGAALHFTSAPHARPLLEILVPLIESNLAGFESTREVADDKRIRRGTRAVRRRRK
jgi:AcrR family transcriptional regulator